MKDKTRNKEEWLEKWREEIERGRQSLEDYMKQNPEERDMFPPETRRPRRKRINPLAKLKNVDWNVYDETLKANRVDGPHSPFKGDWNLDSPPPEED